MIEMKVGLEERLPIGGEEETEEQKCCLDVLILIPPAFVTQCLLLF